MKENIIEYIPLTSDYMFKKVFIENPEILKKLLISVLKLDMNPDLSTLRFLNTELPKSRKKEYRKTVDILVSIDDKKVIDVEINTENYNDIKARNTLYIEKIISMGIEKSTTYQDMSNYYFYQLNLNTKGKNNYFKDKYFTFKEKFTNEILTSNIEIIYKSLDYYRDIYYNKNITIKNDILWLLLICSQNFEELENIAKQLMSKQEYQKFIKSVRDGCMEEMSIANWEADKMEALVRETVEKNRNKEIEKANKEKEKAYKEKEQAYKEKEQAYKEKEQAYKEKERAQKEVEVIKKEFEKNKEQLFQEGIKQNSIHFIKSMLKNGIDCEIISKVSGKTIEEIKKIEDSMYS